MKIKPLLLYVLIGSIGFSCSPRISTNITKKYPQQSLDVQVAIYTNEKDVPPQSEPIGTVSISDTGFSTKCDSATVFSMARSETLNAGGNGLLVTRHLRPTIMGSSCHQISGTMLLIPDFYGTEKKTPESFQEQPALTSYRSANRFPEMAFMLDGGYNWRTAKMSSELSDYQRHLINQVKSGFLWSGSVSYYFSGFIGVGLNFQQYISTHEEYAQNTDTGETGELKLNDRITYIGPSCVFQLPLGKSNWIFDASAGFGYIGYKSKMNFSRDYLIVSGASLGTQLKVGLSYRITPELGIGFKLNAASGVLYQCNIEENGHKTTEKFEENQGEGLGQIGITLGIRYYINSKK